MRWLIRTFGKSFFWKLGCIAALFVVALVEGWFRG